MYTEINTGTLNFFLFFSFLYVVAVKKIFKKRISNYSRASRYTASSCTDLDNARFEVGPKIFEVHVFDEFYFRCTNFWLFFPKHFWDSIFLINCYLRCTDFWFCPIGYLSLFLNLHNEGKVYLKEHYNFQKILFKKNIFIIIITKLP